LLILQQQQFQQLKQQRLLQQQQQLQQQEQEQQQQEQGQLQQQQLQLQQQLSPKLPVKRTGAQHILIVCFPPNFDRIPHPPFVSFSVSIFLPFTQAPWIAL
jgi:hypothetical protein